MRSHNCTCTATFQEMTQEGKAARLRIPAIPTKPAIGDRDRKNRYQPLCFEPLIWATYSVTLVHCIIPTLTGNIPKTEIRKLRLRVVIYSWGHTESKAGGHWPVTRTRVSLTPKPRCCLPAQGNWHQNLSKWTAPAMRAQIRGGSPPHMLPPTPSPSQGFITSCLIYLVVSVFVVYLCTEAGIFFVADCWHPAVRTGQAHRTHWMFVW